MNVAEKQELKEMMKEVNKEIWEEMEPVMKKWFQESLEEWKEKERTEEEQTGKKRKLEGDSPRESKKVKLDEQQDIAFKVIFDPCCPFYSNLKPNFLT